VRCANFTRRGDSPVVLALLLASVNPTAHNPFVLALPLASIDSAVYSPIVLALLLASIPFGGHADLFSAPGLTAYSLVKP
jgi:hypothetical protein